MNFAGLDVGTTGAKAIVVDESGSIVASSYQSYPLITPFDGWCELNPNDVWSACKRVLSAVSLQLSGDYVSLAVSSHAQAVVPVDRTGNVLYNFIATVDMRTSNELEFWKKTTEEYEMYLRTGLPFSAIYTANKLLWIKKHEPVVFESAHRFFNVQDFINWKLTGIAAIDCSLAGRGMLLNLQTQTWDDQILDIIGIKKSQLSTVLPSGSVIGSPLQSVASELNLNSKLIIVSGGHDQTCGCIGSGVVHPGQVMNSTGTVEVFQHISPKFITDREILKYHYPCTPYIIGNTYLVMSINNSGGLLLQWYLNTFCQYEKQKAIFQNVDPYDYVIDSSSEKASNVFFLPHLNGAETPYQDSDSACSIVHMRTNTSKADITRGLLDSMAYEMKLNLETFSKIGCNTKEIRAIGGGARNSKLLQIKADVAQVPVISFDVKEVAALGAAIIGAVGTKEFSSFDEAIESMVRPAAVFYPNSSLASEYQERYEEYKQLYPALRDFNRTVSERVKKSIRSRINENGCS